MHKLTSEASDIWFYNLEKQNKSSSPITMFYFRKLFRAQLTPLSGVCSWENFRMESWQIYFWFWWNVKLNHKDSNTAAPRISNSLCNWTTTEEKSWFFPSIFTRGKKKQQKKKKKNPTKNTKQKKQLSPQKNPKHPTKTNQKNNQTPPKSQEYKVQKMRPLSSNDSTNLEIAQNKSQFTTKCQKVDSL